MVDEFINSYARAVDRYTVDSSSVEAGYLKYRNNSTYLGEAADASKQFIGRIQLERFHAKNREIQKELYNRCVDIQEMFKSRVDAAPNAKIDTDTLDDIKKEHHRIGVVVEDNGYNLEAMAKDIRKTYGEFGNVTIPDYRYAADKYKEFCGNRGFIDKCAEKLVTCDEDAKQHLKRASLKEKSDDFQKNVKAVARSLEGIEPCIENMEKRFLGLLTQGIKNVKLDKNDWENKLYIFADGFLNKFSESVSQLSTVVEKAIDSTVSNLETVNNNIKKADDLIIDKILNNIPEAEWSKGLKDIVKKISLVDVATGFQTVNARIFAKILSNLTDIFAKDLKYIAEKAVEKEPALLTWARMQLFAAPFVAYSLYKCEKEGDFSNFPSYVIKYEKAYTKGGAKSLVDMVGGIIKLPDTIFKLTDFTGEKASDLLKYVMTTNPEDLPADVKQKLETLSGEIANVTEAAFEELKKKIDGMSEEEWFEGAGYVAVFIASLLLGSKAVGASKTGKAAKVAEVGEEAMESVEVAEKIEGVEKIAEVGEAVKTTEAVEKVGSEVLDDVCDGVKKASEFLKEQGVPRQFRKQVLESFDVRTIKLEKAGEKTFGLRFYGGNANAEGRYLFETFSPLTNRENLALPPEWNSMTGIQQFQVKNGTTIITGRAASQIDFGSQYIGGAKQWYINRLEDLIRCH